MRGFVLVVIGSLGIRGGGLVEGRGPLGGGGGVGRDPLGRGGGGGRDPLGGSEGGGLGWFGDGRRLDRIGGENAAFRLCTSCELFPNSLAGIVSPSGWHELEPTQALLYTDQLEHVRDNRNDRNNASSNQPTALLHPPLPGLPFAELSRLFRLPLPRSALSIF